jgi:predicted MPP superfamily phosphohydrolase
MTSERLPRETINRRRFLAAAGVGLVGVAAPTTYGFAAEPRHVGLSLHDVLVPGLPEELDGLRIIQVSDVHLYAGIHPAARRTMELVAAARPDVTLLTGDLCERAGQLGNLGSLIAACRGRLATVAVMGNWEYAAGISPGMLARTAEAAEAELLYNQARVLTVGNAALAVVGLDDPAAGYADPERALGQVPAGATTLWTFHSPGFADRISPDRFPRPTFVAAGHTHGGQIRLPPLPALTPPGSGRFVAGWYRDTFAPLYVSRGVGTTGIRARFLCPPEIALFTLRRT